MLDISNHHALDFKGCFHQIIVVIDAIVALLDGENICIEVQRAGIHHLFSVHKYAEAFAGWIQIEGPVLHFDGGNAEIRVGAADAYIVSLHQDVELCRNVILHANAATGFDYHAQIKGSIALNLQAIVIIYLMTLGVGHLFAVQSHCAAKHLNGKPVFLLAHNKVISGFAKHDVVIQSTICIDQLQAGRAEFLATQFQSAFGC
ncbi:hypothetical protein DSECCO2_504430 [anaerobic digester metagenome]